MYVVVCNKGILYFRMVLLLLLHIVIFKMQNKRFFNHLFEVYLQRVIIQFQNP